MKITALAVGAILALGVVTGAHAAVLSLDMSGSPSYQQTQNSPCVIGDPSCNNPSGFGSTTLASNPPLNTYTNVGSPTYTVQQIRNLVGNVFRVGIDINTTQTPATEILDSFSLAINSVTQFLYTGPTQFANNANGNGYSDALLSGFDLTSFLGTASAQFFVTFHGATDGREEFFLVGAQQPPVPGLPEPATLMLLGLGLSALAIRRKKAS